MVEERLLALDGVTEVNVTMGSMTAEERTALFGGNKLQSVPLLSPAVSDPDYRGGQRQRRRGQVHGDGEFGRGGAAPGLLRWASSTADVYGF